VMRYRTIQRTAARPGREQFVKKKERKNPPKEIAKTNGPPIIEL
jgi:hypothetical protein